MFRQFCQPYRMYIVSTFKVASESYQNGFNSSFQQSFKLFWYDSEAVASAAFDQKVIGANRNASFIKRKKIIEVLK